LIPLRSIVSHAAIGLVILQYIEFVVLELRRFIRIARLN